MNVNGFLMTFVMMLFLIILILTIVILTVVLWGLIVFVRVYFPVLLGRNRDFDENEKESGTVAHASKQIHFERQPFDCGKGEKQCNQSEQVEFSFDSKETAARDDEENCRVTENGDEFEYLDEFNFAPPKAIGKAEEIFENVVIGVINVKTLNNLGNKAQFSENPRGNLTIYDEKNGDYFVKPVADSISEKDYQYSGLNKCFGLSREFKVGYLYKIIDLKKPCIMRKNGDYFEVVKMGELQIEKMED